MSRTAPVLALLLVVGACGDDDADDGSAADGGEPARDQGAPVDAFVEPLVDPATFDCRAGAVERTSTRPLHCALDPSCTERLVSAHRGAGAPGELAPEDTLSAFRAAIVAGADLTELDVRITADEVPVVIHDDTVDRTTEGTGEVSALTLEELQALAIDASAYTGDFGCERVPTLAEVLALTEGRITVVIDGTKTDRIELLVAAVQGAGAVEEVILDASPETIEAALALEPALPFFVRADSVEALEAIDLEGDPAPRYVHVGGSTDGALLAAVDDAGQRAFGLAFTADVAYALGGDDRVYLDLWDAGLQMLQTNRPEIVARLLE